MNSYKIYICFNSQRKFNCVFCCDNKWNKQKLYIFDILDVLDWQLTRLAYYTHSQLLSKQFCLFVLLLLLGQWQSAHPLACYFLHINFAQSCSTLTQLNKTSFFSCVHSQSIFLFSATITGALLQRHCIGGRLGGNSQRVSPSAGSSSHINKHDKTTNQRCANMFSSARQFIELFECVCDLRDHSQPTSLHRQRVRERYRVSTQRLTDLSPPLYKQQQHF